MHHAGWATVTVAVTAGTDGAGAATLEETVTHASCGRVVTMPGDPGYSGATAHTNNTGELTGLLQAVCLEEAREPAPVEFCVDSTYAINIATGKWPLRRTHRELGRRLNHAMARLRKARGHKNVTVRHVRAHTKDAGNETADALAKASATDSAFGGDGEAVLRLACARFQEVIGQKLGQELGDG